MTSRPSRPRPALRTSEAEWQDQVLDLAAIYGWMGYHVPDSRRVTGPVVVRQIRTCLWRPGDLREVRAVLAPPWLPAGERQ